jgi:GNAT superfamily N-acetyltransferase
MRPGEWRWQYPGNPFSRPIAYVAETDDHRLIGHYSLLPRPYLRRGRPTLAALSVISMVHPDHQRRGILKLLAAAAEKQLDDDGVEIGITFLNDNSLHAYTQHFGWTELGGPNFIYFTVLDGEGVFKKLLKNDTLARLASAASLPFARLAFGSRGVNGRAIPIRTIERFDERADALWTKFSAGLGSTIDRTAKYMNWRLVQKPDTYTIFAAEESDRLLGIVVTKTDRKFGLYFGYIVELFFEPDALDVGRGLVERALAELRTQGCSMASAVTHGSPSVRRALLRTGFWRLPRRAMPHGIHFCYKDRRSPASVKPAKSNDDFFLSWMDHDVV